MGIEETKFKQFKTSRGINYHYYFSPAAEGKPYLFFSHGFPSGAYLWRKQIAFFEPLGFGLCVPNLLGYGGTDKPTDPLQYVGSRHAHDVVEILDHEKIDKVIAIGHDWGSRVVSRTYNWHPERVIASAFCGVGYSPPDTVYTDPIAQSSMIKEMVGYDIVAYMRYFIQPDAPATMEKNFDSFISILFPEKPEVWIDNMCVPDGCKNWIESNTVTALPSHMTLEDREHYRKNLTNGQLSAPLCWYKVLVTPENAADDAKAPKENHDLKLPVLFVAFTKDCIALPMFGDGVHAQYVKGPYTREEVAADHWGCVSNAEEVNDILLKWINGLAP